MNRLHWILLLLLSTTRLHNVSSAIADVEDGIEEDEDPDTSYYTLDDLLRLLAFDIVNSSGLTVHFGEENVTVYFPAAPRQGVVSYFGDLAPGFSFDKVQSIIGTEPDISFLDFTLDSITISGKSHEISLHTRAVSSITVIPDFLELANVAIQIQILVQFDADSISDRFLFHGLSLSGSWNVGDSILDFQIDKTGRDFFCKASQRSGTLEVGEFAQTLGTALMPKGDLEEAVKNSGLDRLKLDNAKTVGQYNSGEGFAVDISGNPVLDGWGSLSHNHVLITRYTGPETRTVVTLGIQLNSFRLSVLINRVSGFDISDVPILGNLLVPNIGLVVSTGDLSPNLLPDAMDGILGTFQDIRKGVSIAARLDLVSGRSPVQFVIDITGSSIDFHPGEPEAPLLLQDLLSAVLPDFSMEDLDLPPGISHILNQQVPRFSFTKNPKLLQVELKLDDSFAIIPGYVSILDPTVIINMTFSKPRKSNIVVTGSWRLGSQEIGIIIEPVEESDQPSTSTTKKRRGFVLRGSIPEINVGEIISNFDVSFLPDEMSAVLQNAGFIDFKIVQPEFTIPIGAPAITMQLSGEPQIGSWSGVTLSAALSKGQGRSLFVAGFEFKDTQFSALIETVTGINVSALTLLERSLQCAVVISAADVNDITLSGDVLSTISIRRGISIAAVFRFPETCHDDAFCEYAKGALGSDVSLQLIATVSSLRQFSFLAVVSNIELGSGLILKDCGLEFAVGVETYVGITGSLSLNDPPLTFTGAIRAGRQGIELLMTMDGVWKRAFGFNWLAFGNGIAAIAIKPDTQLVGFQIGGEIRIGKLDSGRELIARVYLGVDPIMPRRNYFYGSINQASIAKILDAFGISVSLPPVLSQSGFPDGLESSFALETIDLPGGLVIPHGFKLNGTVNILGYKLKADIEILVPTGIDVDIRMDPLNLAGGLLKLHASKSDSSTGPLLVAHIKAFPTPSVNVTAAGYVSLFAGMIEREVFLQITNTQYLFWIRGKLFFVDALLKVYASYGSLQQASFQVYGRLSTSSMEEIANQVKGIIDKAANAAVEKIQAAQNTVNSKQADYDRVVDTLRTKQVELDNANSKFDDAVRWLQGKRNNVNSLCRIRNCGRRCVGCPGWKSCCRRVWGACIGCPSWNRCCFTVRDPICSAANLACEVLRKAAYAALYLAKIAVDNSRWTLDVAKAALKAAEIIVDNNRWPLDVAIGFLEGIKKTVKVGAEAAKFITDLTLGGLIDIRRIEFDVQIGLVSASRFSGTIEVSFLRKSHIELSFELRLNSILDMALDLADAVFPGISGRKKREVEERMKRALPGYSRRHYLPHLYLYRPGQPRSADEDLSNTLKQKQPVYKNDTSPIVLVKSPPYQALCTGDECCARFVTSRETDEQFDRDVEAVKALGEQTKQEARNYETNHPSEQEMKQEIEESLEIPSDSDMETSDTNTREERCLHFKHLYNFVKSVPETLEMVFAEWQKSVHTYKETVAERSKDAKKATDLEEEALAMSESDSDSAKTLIEESQGKRRRDVEDLIADIEDETNKIVDDNEEVAKDVREYLHLNKMNVSEGERTSLRKNITAAKKAAPAIDQVKEGLQTLNITARRRLIQQNAASVKSMLQALNQQLKKQTGYSLDEYINLILDKIETSYESETFLESTDMVDAVERIRNRITQLEGKTLYQAKLAADEMLSDFELVYEKAMCD